MPTSNSMNMASSPEADSERGPHHEPVRLLSGSLAPTPLAILSTSIQGRILSQGEGQGNRRGHSGEKETVNQEEDFMDSIDTNMNTYMYGPKSAVRRRQQFLSVKAMQGKPPHTEGLEYISVIFL